MSVTSSNSGVPDISGSVYSKTQVGAWLWIELERDGHRGGGVAGISLAVRWLGLGTFLAMGLGSIPGRGTKIPQAIWPKGGKIQ